MKKGKLTGKAKEEFLRKMAAGRRKAARKGNPENPRKKNPGKSSKKKGGTRPRKSNEGEIARMSRTAKPLLIKAGGLGVGVLAGSRLAEFLDDKLVTRIDNRHGQAVALLALGMAVLYLSDKYGRKVGSSSLRNLALSAGLGAAAPFVLGALALEGIGGTVAQEPTPVIPIGDEAGAWRYTRRMDPRMVGGMAGTLIAGPQPGSPTMRGTFIDTAPGTAVMRGLPVIRGGSIFERASNSSLL